MPSTYTDWLANIQDRANEFVEREQALRGKNSTSFHYDVAVGNTVLLAEIGSTMCGVSQSEDTGDVDELGVCIEPPEVALGFHNNEAPLFSLYEFRTKERNVRSGDGDVDRNIYGLRKFASLCAKGNPTAIMPLYAPDSFLREVDEFGLELRAHRERFLSKRTGHEFLGYLKGQVRRYLDPAISDSSHASRPELVEAHGWDTKTGYHAVRIAVQGAQLMNQRSIDLPPMGAQRELFLDIRNGVYTKARVLEILRAYTRLLEIATETSDLPDKTDTAQLSVWISDMYRRYWKANEETLANYSSSL